MQIILQVEKYIRMLNKQGKTIQQIKNETGLSSSKLNALRKSEPTTINRADLEILCRYLIDNKVADKSELPADLLAAKPSQFWDLLASRKNMQCFTGVRRDNRGDLLQFAADAEIQKDLVFRVTSTTVSPTVIDQTLVETWNYKANNNATICHQAIDLYTDFINKYEQNVAGVFFGSVKSNPVIELCITAGFEGAKPFTSEDAFASSTRRSVPFFMLYRDGDPHPPSSYAGMQLAKNEPGKGPGFYYEDQPGDWICVPCDPQNYTDVALVYYRYETKSNYLEMVLGGFSGEATNCLAHFLRHGESEKLWPAVFEDDNLVIGIYLIKFTFRSGTERNPFVFRPPYKSEVIPLRAAVVKDRLRPARK